MENKIKVGLVDDQMIIRKGLRYIINSQSDMIVVAEAGDGKEAVTICLREKPDIILMDIHLPTQTGIEATKDILAQIPSIKIILLTTFDVQDYVIDGIRAGAIGYLLKDLETEELLEGIRSAMKGSAIYKSSTASQALAQIVRSQPAGDVHQLDDIESLTDREIDVLQEMAYGHRNSEIASRLFISQGTVKTHVHRILQKLRAEDRTQAVVMAIRQGIVK